jgi:hypothetical protein
MSDKKSAKKKAEVINKKPLIANPTRANQRVSDTEMPEPLKKREMPTADAEKVWFDLRLEHNQDAIDRMPGWTHSAANRAFGPSGRPAGPRPAKKQKR